MAGSSDRSATRDYRERLRYFKDTDAEKNDMINELIQNLENAKLDLEIEKVNRRTLQDQVGQLKSLVASQSGGAFVLVLIDADADDYIFRDRFLNQSAAGGRDAADELNDRIKDYLPSLGVDPANTTVKVRAYADIKGLHGACIKNEKMKTGANVVHFAHGFNQRQGLFDFVDVGPGKESADNKIRECLDFFVGMSQCKHIIFGACHDSGYAPFLGKFAADTSVRDRITLLQGTNVHPRIAALGFRRTLKLDTVFAPNTVPAIASARRPVVLSTSPPIDQISAIVGGKSAVFTQGQSVFVNPAPLSERLGPIILNDEGKRVDKTLNIDIASPYLNVLRHNRLCAYYYLRGRCEGCNHKSHIVSPLNTKEFDCLWYIARHGLCFKAREGKVCGDVKCCYGHEEGCPIGSGRVSH